jgi:hypothetical protein
MRLHGLLLVPSVALYATDSVIAVPPNLLNRNPFPQELSDKVTFPLLYGRDGDEHGHGHGHGSAAPIVQINETDVLLYHDPTPPSYWSIDIDNPDSGNAKHPSLMALHSLFMMFAFLGALPAGSSWHAIPPLLF